MCEGKIKIYIMRSKNILKIRIREQSIFQRQKNRKQKLLKNIRQKGKCFKNGTRGKKFFEKHNLKKKILDIDNKEELGRSKKQ